MINTNWRKALSLLSEPYASLNSFYSPLTYEEKADSRVWSATKPRIKQTFKAFMVAF